MLAANAALDGAPSDRQMQAGGHAKLKQTDAVELVAEAVRSGISNDLGSGSNVDICVIR
jgi:20S proteasome alpha/beta subunit